MDAGSWRWDETLYAGSASYYRLGRLPYSVAVADALAREVGLDGTQRLLDVGCGPGSLTLLLAPRVAFVVGVDADRDMIAAAAGEAERAQIDNVRWLHLRAEALPAGLGRFDVVTFAQSFHWMDRGAVAAATHGMLNATGVCVHVQATTHRGDQSADPLAHPRPPHAQIDDLVREYLGPVRRAGQGRLPDGTPADEHEIFRAAGFVGPARVELDTAEVVIRSEDEIVAATFSLSSATPHLFGARLPAFEADLRRLLRRTSPDGRFAERTRDIALDFWRPAGAAAVRTPGRLSPESLTTERLALDPLRIEDADEMAPLLADPGLHEFIGGAPATVGELRERYRRQIRGRSPDGSQLWLNWVVRRRDSGRAVGTVQATISVQNDASVAELAWVIAAPHQRRGYARESAAEMLRWLRQGGISVVVAYVHPEHAASIAVARALGLRATRQTRDGEVRWEASTHTRRVPSG